MAGKRAWIDVHYHAMNEPFRQALAHIGGIIRTPEWSRQAALDFSDRQDIATGILSLGVPGAHFGDDAKARDLAKRCNEDLANFIAQHPRRFGHFAITPIPDIEGACEAAVHALDTLKADGIILLSSYEGQYVGQPQWDPLLEILNERAAVCFVHPNNPAAAAMVRRGFSSGIGNFLGEFVFDTSRAGLNLLFNDCLDRYPHIKFILAHAGGTLPYSSPAAWCETLVPVNRRDRQRPVRDVEAGLREQEPGDDRLGERHGRSGRRRRGPPHARRATCRRRRPRARRPAAG